MLSIAYVWFPCAFLCVGASWCLSPRPNVNEKPNEKCPEYCLCPSSHPPSVQAHRNQWQRAKNALFCCCLHSHSLASSTFKQIKIEKWTTQHIETEWWNNSGIKNLHIPDPVGCELDDIDVITKYKRIHTHVVFTQFSFRLIGPEWPERHIAGIQTRTRFFLRSIQFHLLCCAYCACIHMGYVC